MNRQSKKFEIRCFRLYEKEVFCLLTDRQKLVIDLMYVEGYKQSEIAELLKISSAAVKKHLDRAKEIIKNNF